MFAAKPQSQGHEKNCRHVINSHKKGKVGGGRSPLRLCQASPPSPQSRRILPEALEPVVRDIQGVLGDTEMTRLGVLGPQVAEVVIDTRLDELSPGKGPVVGRWVTDAWNRLNHGC